MKIKITYDTRTNETYIGAYDGIELIRGATLNTAHYKDPLATIRVTAEELKSQAARAVEADKWFRDGLRKIERELSDAE